MQWQPQSLHASSIKSGLPLANALIAAYSKYHNPRSAQKVFDEIEPEFRDRFSWNSIIAAHASVGDANTANKLVSSMRLDFFEPDTVTWNSIIHANCLANRFDVARQILYRMPAPTVVSWTAVISGYNCSGDHRTAIEVFRKMMLANYSTVLPDQRTLSCVISACRHVADFRSARSAHAYGLKMTADLAAGFYRHAGAALVAMYASSRKISAAGIVFGMMDKGDVVTWNSLLGGFRNVGLDDMALSYFQEMGIRGVRYNERSICIVLPLCKIKLGKEIHGFVVRHWGNATTIRIYNSLIAMYSKSGSVEVANRVFLSMRSRDLVTWNSMIGAYGSNGLGMQAVEVLRLMKESGVRPDNVTFSSMLTACTRCGLVDEGIKIFDDLIRDFGVKPTMENYACVVDLLARSGKFEEALDLIRNMSMTPEAAVWGAFLSACRMHHNVEFGEVAFEQLVELEPENPGNYVTMSSIYVKAGRLQDAKRVRMMIEGGNLVKPSGFSWMDVD